MRLFLAVIPDNSIKDELCFIQKRLQLQGVKGKFTSRENMHMTLAFIGEYSDPDHVSQVTGIVNPLPRYMIRFDCSPFCGAQITVSHLFPAVKRV